MRAIQVTQIGGPEVLEWVELADPAPGPGQLVIDVDTAGVNFIDTYQRTGVYDRPLPFTPDLEIAGVVSAAADDVEGSRLEIVSSPSRPTAVTPKSR